MGIQFITTRWTEWIDPKHDVEARHELIEAYTPAVWEYIWHLVRDEDLADDLSQQFVMEKLLSGALVEKADRTRGKFRSLLVTALRHFTYDALRSRKRHSTTPLPDADGILESNFRSAEHAHDRELAGIILNQAVESTKQTCMKKGMDVQWRVFEARILLPTRGGCQQLNVETLQKELDVNDRQSIYTMSDTVRKMVLRNFRQRTEVLCGDGDDIDEEMKYLLECFAPTSK